jgi:hypothetical protein
MEFSLTGQEKCDSSKTKDWKAKRFKNIWEKVNQKA